MSEYTITYTYDNLNRVIRIERSDGATVTIEYDSKGLLIMKTVSKPDVIVTINATEPFKREGRMYQDSLGTYHFTEHITPIWDWRL